MTRTVNQMSVHFIYFSLFYCDKDSKIIAWLYDEIAIITSSGLSRTHQSVFYMLTTIAMYLMTLFLFVVVCLLGYMMKLQL